MEREYKGLSVVFKTRQEYQILQNFLGNDIAYIEWVSQMGEVETGLVILDNTGLFSTGSVGSANYQRSNEFRTVDFDKFFCIQTPNEGSVIENAVKDYAYNRMTDFEDFDGSEEEFIENYINHNLKQRKP